MKFPISMTADLAKYIFKNKMRPRPEWQKTVAAAPDASNPFRILPSKTGEKRQPHPMINKRFPIVLMLEPLHACNLTCTGCGRIREYESTITERSEEHTSELQSQFHLVCRLLLEKKKRHTK